MFDWENEPYLTFAGLVRLTHHVLCTFIQRQPALEREGYPAWRHELPGTMQVEMAPKYWIWPADGFTPTQARSRFSGLVKHLVELFAGTEKAMPDMTELMKKIEQLAPNCSSADRIPMLDLYGLYQVVIPPEHRRPGWREFLSRFKTELENCSITGLVAWPVLRGEKPPWPVEECVTAFEEYQRKRHKARAVNLPILVEVAIMVAIANLYLEGGDRDAYVCWANRAILDAAGRNAVQDRIVADKREFRLIDTRQLIGLLPAEAGNTDC